MKKITATRPFKPFANLLTQQCPSVTIDGKNWQDDAIITELECYGVTAKLDPEAVDWDMNHRHVNALAFLGLGLSTSQVADVTGQPEKQARFYRRSLIRHMYPSADTRSNVFLGKCVTSFVTNNVIQFNETPETALDVPSDIRAGVIALSSQGTLDDLYPTLDVSPREFDEKLANFSEAQGIPGRGSSGLVMFGHATGILLENAQ
ncbi:MAG TPA: hypothetical protein VLH14_01030 [Patescibacteria group bacterium]|nr:hypothetical protein [Patescibacteria group bacterium]